MRRMRTFIAIDLTKPIRECCLSLQDTLARGGAEVKWVDEHNLHLTLLFLGEVDDRELPALCQVVADCCAQQDSFALSIESVGCFPNPRRPRVVWVGVGEGRAEVSALHDALEPPLLELGCYRREERTYTPHVTLGRVTGDRSTEALATALARQSKWHGGTTQVQEVRVLSSQLTPKGPIYAVLSRAKLRLPGS